MYKNKIKKNNRKIFYILASILIVICLFIFLNKQNFINNSFFNNAKSLTVKVNYFIKSPFIKAYDFFNDLGNFKKIREENLKLKNTNQELNILLNLQEEQKKEIKLLKEELKLKDLYTDYELETSKIINRNTSYWFSNIVIDKGSNSGISIGNAVVTSNGLVGIISSVSDDTSTVKLITSKDGNINISVAVEGNDKYHYGTITDYKNGLIIVNGITNYDGVNINSKVLTSGLGMFPSGILVGYVENQEKDNYDISKILYVKSNQDMNDLKYVTVLKDKK